MPYDDERLAFVFRRLLELSEEWLVNLSNVGDEWTLIVTSLRTHNQHTYTSTDLLRLINHAWAGAPGGRV